jgi:Flp pilus assembly protein TadB
VNRLVVVAASAGLVAGWTLVLAELRWFRRVPLAERLRPHVRAAATRPPTSGVLSVDSLRDVLGPLVSGVGARASRALGLGDELTGRLHRAGSRHDPTSFRLHQFAVGVASLLAVAAVAAVAPVPLPVSLFAPPVAFAVAYLVVEQRLVAASTAWQRRVVLELPVIIEQLGMLLSSGHSLSGAVARIGRRGHGECAGGFRTATMRVGQGLAEVDALREFAAIAQVPALDRLVGVLSLNREASDLGALISTEARLVRREVHRSLVETIERRGQTVWIPVTVATLLPGVIFMAVPFVDAMRQLTG